MKVRIGARPCLDGLRSLGAYQSYGGFASYAVAPSKAMLPIPLGLSFDEAACLLSGHETAYYSLVHRGRLQPDEWVLVHGASGVTGLAAVQLAKLVGAKVIATGRSADKLAVVREAGADHTIVTAGADGGLASFKDEVKELTGGGADVIYDPVGGAISIESMRAARFGARYLIVGWTATPFVAHGKGGRGAPRANQFPTNLVMMKSLDVLGCPAAIAAHRDPSIRRTRLDAILGWVREGRVRPRVGEVYPLAEIKDAMRAKWASRAVGGCVVHP